MCSLLNIDNYCVTTNRVTIQNISITQKLPSCPLASVLSPHLHFLATTGLVSGSVGTSTASYGRNHTAHSLVCVASSLSSIILLGSVDVKVFGSFLLLSSICCKDIPWFVYLSSHQLMNLQVVSRYWSLAVKLLWVFECKSLVKILLSLLLGKNLGVD